MKKVILIIALILGLSASSFATEYYVNFGKGSDKNNGLSETKPFKSFDKVDGLSLQGGDIINVCGFGKIFLASKSGSAGNPITIRPYSSNYSNTTYNGCTLNPTDDSGITLLACSHIVIDGARKNDGSVGFIEICQSQIGVLLDTCHHCVFKNLNLHNLGSSSYSECAAFWESGYSHHNTFIRNFVKAVTASNYGSAFFSRSNSVAQSSVFAYNTVIEALTVARAESGTVVASNNICYNILGTTAFAGGVYTDNNLIYRYNSAYDNSVTGRQDIRDRDPKFDGNTYELTSSSPAVDAGNNTEILTANGFTYKNYGPDLGYYESNHRAECVISGTVTSHYDDGIISGATVTVGTAATTTDSNGKYTIAVRRGANYNITATKDGYTYSGTVSASGNTVAFNIALPDSCLVNGKVTFPDGTPVSGAKVMFGEWSKDTGSDGTYYILAKRGSSYSVDVMFAGDVFPGGTIDLFGAEVTKDVFISANCNISGTVTSDFDGNPVPMATVTIGGVNAVTTGNGRYAMTVPRASSYNVIVIKDGYMYQGTVNALESPVIRNVVLPDACVVSGTVRFTNGDLVSGATITIDNKTFTTGSNGRYSVTVKRKLSSDPYGITVEIGGRTFSGGTVVLSGTSVVKDISIPSLCTVSGTVISDFGGDAVSGASVTVGDYTATTGSDGTYTVVVPKGSSYNFTATKGGYTYSDTVNASGVTTLKNAVIPDACVIGGSVSMAGNVQGDTPTFTVTIGDYTTATDNNRHYEIKVPRGGVYNITAEAYGFASYSGTVDASGTTAEKDVSVTALCVVSGTVISSHNSGPVAGAAVDIDGTESAITGSDGNYLIMLSQGSDVDVSISRDGYETYTAQIDTSAQFVTLDAVLTLTDCVVSGTVMSCFGGLVEHATIVVGNNSTTTDSNGRYSVTVPCGSSGNVTVTAVDHESYGTVIDTDVPSVDLDVILNAVCHVTGTVRSDLTGNPVSGAEVNLNEDAYTATTDENGHYDITIVVGAPTTYGMTVSKDGYTFSGEVTFTELYTTVNPVIPDAFTVSGYVTSVLGDSAVSGATVQVNGLATTTNGWGWYELKVPRVGSYDIEVSADGFEIYDETIVAEEATVYEMNIELMSYTGPEEDIEFIDNPEDLKNVGVGKYVDVYFNAKVLNNMTDFADRSVYVETGAFEGYKVIIPEGEDVNKGDIINFTGYVREDEDGKYVEAEDIAVISVDNPVRAVGMTNDMLNTNALVRVWGRVAGTTEDFFVINTACGDVIIFPEKNEMPEDGSFVIVTGIASPGGVRAVDIVK